MEKQLFLIFLLWGGVVVDLNAQWTKKDSLWLQKMLSGEEKIELNEETKKAIQQGIFLRSESPASSLRTATPPLPVVKDFSEYTHPDSATSSRKVALKDLPSYIFWFYTLPEEKVLPVYQSILDELKRNPLKGALESGVVATFDAGELTSRKAYIHRRNVKRDGTWKNYNNLPTGEILQKKKTYATAEPEKAGQDTLLLRKKALPIEPDSLKD